MPLREVLNATRIVELCPFGAQCSDCILLARDVHAQLRKALHLARGIKFYLVDIARSEQQRSDHADVEKPHHRIMPESGGNAGRSVLAEPGNGRASVRSAARSLAERARGLFSTSAASGTMARFVSTRNVGASCAICATWRETVAPPLRWRRNCFTSRSSRE